MEQAGQSSVLNRLLDRATRRSNVGSCSPGLFSDFAATSANLLPQHSSRRRRPALCRRAMRIDEQWVTPRGSPDQEGCPCVRRGKPVGVLGKELAKGDGLHCGALPILPACIECIFRIFRAFARAPTIPQNKKGSGDLLDHTRPAARVQPETQSRSGSELWPKIAAQGSELDYIM